MLEKFHSLIKMFLLISQATKYLVCFSVHHRQKINCKFHLGKFITANVGAIAADVIADATEQLMFQR